MVLATIRTYNVIIVYDLDEDDDDEDEDDEDEGGHDGRGGEGEEVGLSYLQSSHILQVLALDFYFETNFLPGGWT